MIAQEYKTCESCGKPIEGANKRQKYCSNGCRQNQFRSRHGVAVPAFLQVKAPKRIVEKKNQIIKRVANPQYQQVADQIRAIEGRISTFEAQRREITNEQARLLNRNDELLNGLSTAAISASTLVGITILGMLLSANIKDKEEKKRIMLIAALVALGAAVFSALATHSNIKEGRYKKKVKRLEQLKLQADELEIKTLEAGAELSAYGSQLETLPKQIEQQEVVKYYEQELGTSEKLVTLSQLAAKTFDTLPMGQMYVEWIGEPERNFAMALHGEPGQGKSTFAIDLAKDLGVHQQRVLFIAAEEGLGKSQQKKWNGYTSQYITLADYRNLSRVKDELKRSSYDVVFLDSVQEMKISPQQLKDLRNAYSNTAFIYILQSTKGGNFKGSNEYAHDADVKIKIANYKPIIEKTRYK